MAREETNIDHPPQVFLREVQTESDTRRLLNYHRILHAWMDEILSPSKLHSIGDNNWTPRWIRPAHDLVVRRILQLDPGFEHNTPMGAACTMPPLPPLVLDAAHVQVIGAGPAGFRLLVRGQDDSPRVGEFLRLVFGEGTEVVYGSAMPEAPLAESAYQLALVPVDFLGRQWRPRDVARSSFRRLMAGGPPVRFAQGMILCTALVDDLSTSADAVAAARSAAEWARSGRPFPKDVMVLGASKLQIEGDAVRWLEDLMRPVDDMVVFERAVSELRRRLGEVVMRVSDPVEREREVRRLVVEIAEGAKS